MRERTVTFFDQVMTERITREARDIHFWRTALTVIAGLLFGIGWVAYKALAAIWFVLAWCAAAVKVGWREARAADRT
jgi:hypothetical protein